MSEKRIIDIRHPIYTKSAYSWKKWRSVYEGGDCFVEEYTKKFSARETEPDFKCRREITPCPAVAKSCLNDIKNSIFQRLVDIVRRGGSESYQQAVGGADGGVDLHGKSMNTYMGTEVLPELLSMAKVGVYVDAPPVAGPTRADQLGQHPYLYTYKVEEIMSWSYRRDRVDEFQSVLLRDWVDDCDDCGLPQGAWCRYRHVWLQDGKVYIQFYDEDCGCCDLEGNPTTDGPMVLDIDRIPFVILEISGSLLEDTATHQIALLNLESSDISYALKANFPFYIEQRDERMESAYLRNGDGSGTAAGANQSNTSGEIKVGVTQGRYYGKDLDPPSFIHPSPEPLKASMEKQRQLKEDIRTIMNLALSNIQPKMASAESKSFDERGLESGLSYIGLELEHAERKIADYWRMYEPSGEPATVQYPKKYSLQTDESRRKDAEQLEDLRDVIPSERFQKSISKQIVQTLLGGKMSVEEIDGIFQEIDEAKCYTANPETIFSAIENGIMSLEIAAELLGLPPESVEQAAKDHADRAARVAAAQAIPDPGARGVDELSADPNAANKERDTATDDVPADNTRGEGQ